MRLSEVVSRHGFSSCDLADIKNAKLYARSNPDGVTELLCVQKVGNVFRIDRLPMMQLAPDVLIPVGEGITNQIVPKEDTENYLNLTLAPAR